jgi:hypothetical protein
MSSTRAVYPGDTQFCWVADTFINAGAEVSTNIATSYFVAHVAMGLRCVVVRSLLA